MDWSKDPTAVVDEGACIGAGTRVWHFAHICAGAVIGADVSLGQNVFVADGVTIGNRCKVQNNVSLYEGVTLAEDVFCGPSMVFTNVINPRAAVPRRNEFRRTEVGRGATFGANCTIVCGHVISEYAFIAAGAVVTGDVPPFALMAGVPARRIGWMSRHGERLPRGEGPDGEGEVVCPASGERYRVTTTDCVAL